MGGNEPPLVNGHLGGGEPIVKPTQKVGLNFYKGVVFMEEGER